MFLVFPVLNLGGGGILERCVAQLLSTFRLGLFEGSSRTRRLFSGILPTAIRYEGHERMGSARLRVTMKVPPVSNSICFHDISVAVSTSRPAIATASVD